MSHNWNHRQQRQEQVVEEQEENGYPHVRNQQPQNHLVPMSKCEVAELAWENGQLAMHRLGNNLPNEQTKHTWERASDTLESVVHQATNCQKQNLDLKGSGKNKANINTENIVKQQTIGVAKKRTRSDSDPQLYGTSGRLVGEFHKNIFYQNAEPSASASAKDTVMTWPNYSLDESSRSFKSKATFNEDSACHAGLENKEEERETKAYNSLRRSRTAAVHNQSERRRRDRINEKMKALQKLVPNASKTDKASMLDEVIKYLKQLQAQIQLISNARNMESQIMMPPLSLGLMQPHIQMPLLARMGMGVNLGMTTGMLDNMTANLARAAAATTPHQFFTAPFIYPTSVATSCPPFMSPAFAMAPTIPTPPQANGDTCASRAAVAPSATHSFPLNTSASRAAVAPSATHSFPFNDPRSAFLAQSVNMEFNNQLAAQYMQQTNNQSMQTRNKNLNQGSLNQRQTE